MFGNKLLVYIKKPSVYNLRKMQSVEDRKLMIEQRLGSNKNMTISPNNQEYAEAFDLVLKDKEAEMMAYEKSWLWSPVYTPNHFKYMFLLPATMVLLLMLYIRYTHPLLQVYRTTEDPPQVQEEVRHFLEGVGETRLDGRLDGRVQQGR